MVRVGRRRLDRDGNRRPAGVVQVGHFGSRLARPRARAERKPILRQPVRNQAVIRRRRHRHRQGCGRHRTARRAAKGRGRRHRPQNTVRRGRDEFKIEILYSEPVGRNVAAYGTLDLGPDGPRAPIGVAGIGASSLHTVTFGGDEAAADNATGTLIVNQTGLEDVSGNALGGNASSREMVADGQRPEIKSSAVTGSNNITVQYSEPVAAPLSAYRSLTLTSHETSLSSAHAIRNFTGNSTHVHVIGFDTAAPNNVAGTLTIYANAS